MRTPLGINGIKRSYPRISQITPISMEDFCPETLISCALIRVFRGSYCLCFESVKSAKSVDYSVQGKEVFTGSICKKSIPAAPSATSTLATILSAARSTISTVPGSDPIPSTETKA